MIKITTDKDNVLQTAIASLLEFNIREVPYFDGYGAREKWSKMYYFVRHFGYYTSGSLYNSKIVGGNIDTFTYLFSLRGVKGYFLAMVNHLDGNLEPGNHVVIIDKLFNIVNPILEKYEGITKFPLHGDIGYNGIKQILLINENKEHDV